MLYVYNHQQKRYISHASSSPSPIRRATKGQAQARLGLRLSTEAHAQTLRSVGLVEVDAWSLGNIVSFIGMNRQSLII